MSILPTYFLFKITYRGLSIYGHPGVIGEIPAIRALDALEKFIHTRSEIPQLVRAGLIHYQFEAIHPFLDGNGRVGRLIVSMLLIEWGLISQPLLYLSAFFERNRDLYLDLLLHVSETGEWKPWVDFFLRGVLESAEEAGILQETTGRRRGQVFLANEIMSFMYDRPRENPPESEGASKSNDR